jgi:hypothetical protein
MLAAMRFLVLAIALAGFALPARAVYYGETRAELIKELGKPSSELKRGARDVLIYKTGRIELEDGKVAVVQGMPVTDGPVTAPVPATVATPPPAAPSSEKPAETKSAAPKVETKATPNVTVAHAKSAPTKPKSTEQEMIEQDAAARTKMEKEIEALENPKPATPIDHGPPRWVTFLVELAIKAVMMLAALKLTTKYWSVDISWMGLVIAAAADTVTRAIVGAIALWALGMGTTLYADEATAALVLVMVLRKVSYNQSLSQAVTITLTSKTFVVVVGSFLSVFVMHTLFGSSGGGLMPF